MQIIGRAVVAAAGLAALAACGGGGSNKAEQPDATANTSAAAPAPTTPAAPAAPAAVAAPAPDDVTTKTGVTLAQFTADPTKGEAAFAPCKTCHVTDPGQNRIGPSLHQVVGRQAGSIAGFNYSAAHKNSGITWSKEKLFQYLEDPRRVVPGNKMIFAGIPDPQKRADLIAWLETK